MIVVSKKQTDNLTRGKSYEVLEVEPSRYRIVSDRNKIITTSINNFYNIDEWRELTLNNILNKVSDAIYNDDCVDQFQHLGLSDCAAALLDGRSLDERFHELTRSA
jgi:hypothetical protein